MKADIQKLYRSLYIKIALQELHITKVSELNEDAFFYATLSSDEFNFTHKKSRNSLESLLSCLRFPVAQF